MKLTKGKVIGALAILVILAAAFWYGGNAPGLQGWTVGVRESSPVLESIQPSQTPEETGKDGNSPEPTETQGLWKPLRLREPRSPRKLLHPRSLRLQRHQRLRRRGWHPGPAGWKAE